MKRACIKYPLLIGKRELQKLNTVRDIMPKQWEKMLGLKNSPHIFSSYGTMENLKGPRHESTN
jgi:hypothetical protein